MQAEAAPQSHGLRHGLPSVGPPGLWKRPTNPTYRELSHQANAYGPTAWVEAVREYFISRLKPRKGVMTGRSVGRPFGAAIRIVSLFAMFLRITY